MTTQWPFYHTRRASIIVMMIATADSISTWIWACFMCCMLFHARVTHQYPNGEAVTMRRRISSLHKSNRSFP
ncbi:hypothetical protein F5Y16DRAFT_358261 [Xylariaceae sp. FL0255]|nr:hypothetical protein F5Y16DRAFT_358261 [Xylariaceae sp. FL0255]